MKILRKVSDTIFQIEKVCAAVLVFVMLGALVSGVAFRYLFNSPLIWSDEVAIFALVWITFVGGSMGIKLDQAASVTIITDFLKKRPQQIVFAIGWGIVFVFCLFFLIYSCIWVTSPSIGVQKSSTLQIPMLYPYLSVPFGFFCLTFHTLSKFADSLFDWREKGE
ncbi:TRAP transporter small permease [Brevibacillus ruminantium]|uniref:TRAP transporter small permease n=1 Tax=Brevibacillus ruminantium TaxID=2950604 RepID=A0ABY4WG85_9BACL|nr:TRAP transporter small permease [Brevibacillus ruminantium]USG64339.1 TRAP transporter small permease [Brevibacillus ruminantium]